ncbi:hypothetical protein [Streptomyces silvisoli]|uniref:Uncharacterized protein n=1 Tax=Streptomyces silvisoli TaxID=3034235 RepID=A0ABT5ZXE5_9ACTN|nr:hypothetical protein [Streptomyces silvisoli]MDF3294321.1 hypothetical protein [Streptomyces silvisoli]
MKWMMGSGHAIGAANIAAATNSPELLQKFLGKALADLDINPIIETGTLRRELRSIQGTAHQAAQSGYPVTPFSLDIQNRMAEFLNQESATLGARLANAFSAGAHLGWGYMRCAQHFQLDTVQTNIQHAGQHLKAIDDSGIHLDYAKGISELSQQYAQAHTGHPTWATVAELFETFTSRMMDALPPP